MGTRQGGGRPKKGAKEMGRERRAPHFMARVCLLFAAALVATHALDEGFVEVLDESTSEHLAEDLRGVVPFLDADELLQIKGMVQKANSVLQGKLASDAESLHLAKLEVEKAASSASLSYKKADATAQAAKKQAMSSKSASDVDKAMELTKKATAAKDTHTKLQKDQSEARIKADTALKKAQESGATVNLSSPSTATPSTSSSSLTTAPTTTTAPIAPPVSATATPPVVPGLSSGAASAPSPKIAGLLPDPPGIVKAKEPTSLETILKQRRKKRVEKEAHMLREKYEAAKVEKQQSDYVLSQKMAAYQKVKTSEAEAQSAKSAARKEQQLDEAKIIKAHIAVGIAHRDYKQAKRAEGLAKAWVRVLGVQKEVASSLAKTGGARRALKEADKQRTARNENLKTDKADIVSSKLAVEKAKAATAAAKAGFTAKTEALQGLQRALSKADRQFSNAVYKISGLKGKEETAKEDKIQAAAEDKIDNKKYKTAHALATAAALKVNNSKGAEEKSLKALLNDPKEAKKEAILKVKDQNGISDLGTPLIAAKGAIAEAYKKKFNALPLPQSGRNPILEAQAKASLTDSSAAAALKVATPLALPQSLQRRFQTNFSRALIRICQL